MGPADTGTGLPRLVLLEPNDGCLTMARRLAARGVEVVALCPPANAWVGRSRALRDVPVGPVPDGADRPWLPALAALGDRPGVLVCGSDAASEFVVAYRREIPSVLRSFETADGAHLLVMQKDTLRGVAEEAQPAAPSPVSTKPPRREVLRASHVGPCLRQASVVRRRSKRRRLQRQRSLDGHTLAGQSLPNSWIERSAVLTKYPAIA